MDDAAKGGVYAGKDVGFTAVRACVRRDGWEGGRGGATGDAEAGRGDWVSVVWRLVNLSG